MLTVKKIIDEFQLKLISGNDGINKEITNIDVSRPGLEMAGYFSHYSSDRIQILGMTEISFFERMLTEEEREDRPKKLCRKETPCIIITRNLNPPLEFIEACNQSRIPLLVTEDNTTNFTSRISNHLEKALAPETNMHGVLVDIYGIGVLITGESGVGKSETALELVKNGHRLVADDNVEIKEVSKNVLIGASPPIIRNLLEIRGLGIINVMTLFGAGSILEEKRVMLNVSLEAWEKGKTYERLGLDQKKLKILNTEIDQKTIPIRPGRSLAGIIEVAAMNYRMQYMGYDAAQEFNDRLNRQIQINGGMIDDL
ncbi:HPr(Ser) kinase/phosphatase [Salinicoccus jeotgali]|uniref:HPr kinase/phosphorylase n=1 Tax=Salinicoccus jeotgali TaxID=381634 RepID=A0ABP7F9K1_9STAP